MNEENSDMTNDGAVNPFKASRKQEEWPEEVMIRFKMSAERTGESVNKVAEAFVKHISEQWGCEDWKAEDEDVLIDWAEGMLIEDRSSNVSGGGASGTVQFVGHWIGVEDKTADRNGWNVRNATQKWTENQNQAISDGVVGHYFKEDGVWSINTANGVMVTTDSIDEKPSLAFRVGEDYLCLISRQGRPYPAERIGRYYRFLGNEKNAFFTGEGAKPWRVDLTDDNRHLEIDIGRPVSIQVRLPTTQNEAFQDVLGTNYNFSDTMAYGDDWCPEHLQRLLDPFKMWTDSDTVGELAANLHNLEDAFESGKRTFTGRDGQQGVVGPDVIVRGTVTRMNTEGRESEWDETGRNFSLSITSLHLQNKEEGRRAEVVGWVSGACNDLTHPFQFRDVDDELWGYGQRSSVLVYGRLKLKIQDGETSPQLSVFGVYTDSKKAWRQAGGGDTGAAQFE
tara:strand:- start:3328 stop:4680 length:1353 start_codon:yes stop_codon:yes gene_type:complete